MWGDLYEPSAAAPDGPSSPANVLIITLQRRSPGKWADWKQAFSNTNSAFIGLFSRPCWRVEQPESYRQTLTLVTSEVRVDKEEPQEQALRSL